MSENNEKKEKEHEAKIFYPPLQATILAEKMQRAVAPVSRLAKEYAKIGQVANQLPQLNLQLPDFSYLAELIPKVKPIIPPDAFESLQNTFRKLREIEDSDFEFKWLENVPMSFFMEVYGVYEEEGNEGATRFLTESLSDPESLDTLKEDLKKFDYYSNRQKIIEQALEAHKEGRYALSTPVFFTQIDGIFVDLGQDLGIWEEKEDPIGVKVVTKGEGSEKHISGIDGEFRDYYGRMMGKDTLRAKVLHGLITTHADDETLSAKTIWLLFESLHIIDRILRNRENTS